MSIPSTRLICLRQSVHRTQTAPVLESPLETVGIGVTPPDKAVGTTFSSTGLAVGPCTTICGSKTERGKPRSCLALAGGKIAFTHKYKADLVAVLQKYSVITIL